MAKGRGGRGGGGRGGRGGWNPGLPPDSTGGGGGGGGGGPEGPDTDCWLRDPQRPAADEARRGQSLVLRPYSLGVATFDSKNRLVGYLSEDCATLFNLARATRARIVEVIPVPNFPPRIRVVPVVGA